MRLTFLSNQKVVISRMTALSGGKNYYSTVTSALVHKQQIGIEKTELVGGVFGKTYVIYCDTDIDVKEGDRIKDESGNIYKVKKGGLYKAEMGNVEYYKLIIEQVT